MESKIIKTYCLQNDKISYRLIVWLWKFLFLITQLCRGHSCYRLCYHFIYVIFSIGKAYFYEFFHNILQAVLSEVISETTQVPIKTFIQYFEQKSIIFSDISLPRLGKNMSIYSKLCKKWLNLQCPEKSINYMSNKHSK